MELARNVFDIPMVLEPEYLASPYLDDLSGMTYLSYFMRENSPGFFATLRWVTGQIPQMKIKNFTVRASVAQRRAFARLTLVYFTVGLERRRGRLLARALARRPRAGIQEPVARPRALGGQPRAR